MKIRDFCIVDGNEVKFKDDIKFNFKTGDDIIENILGAVIYKSIVAKSRTDKKDYRLSSIDVSPKLKEDICNYFGSPNIIKIFGVFMTESDGSMGYGYVEHHYTWTIFEMGKE